MEEKRLDVLLTELQFARSREKAKQLIIDKLVYVNGKLADKPSMKVSSEAKIDVNTEEIEYVGRGAYKLEKAIGYFNIDLDNKVAIDVGASTGGFTDYMLKNNCSKVYAIDVGYNQLAESLLKDNRVVSLEKTNFRYMDKSVFTEDIDFICIDVSFISLQLILPKVAEICNDKTDVIALVKPQFEAGKGNVGKNGIIKDRKMHVTVLNNVFDYCLQNDLYVNNITYSPIMGGDGNREYLIHVKKAVDTQVKHINNIIESVVKDAFNNIKHN